MRRTDAERARDTIPSVAQTTVDTTATEVSIVEISRPVGVGERRRTATSTAITATHRLPQGITVRDAP